MTTILCVVGARPNFMKIAPIMKALKGVSASLMVHLRLVHTGQHYDIAMNQQFFDQLGIPQPDIELEVGSASHAVQTAEIMRRFEPVIDAEQPAAVLVVGDVNSTIACALVAAKKQVAVIHVEAGLRSYDRSMPEEINRVLTDQLAALLFTTERCARDNLLREGIAADKIHLVGNVMIDTLFASLDQAVPAQRTLQAAVQPELFLDGGFGVVTLHRPSNVDEPATFKRLLSVLREISIELPLAFPLHPRTAKAIAAGGLDELLATPRILRLPPLGYLDMLGLTAEAKLVLTDSGGLQEETTALGIPCITLRHNTERPITVEQGTNTVVGTDPAAIYAAARDVLVSGGKAGRVPEYWDGRAAERIAAVISDWLRSHERNAA
jgi:UDP-N-acetylglucosamine 2-epimerase (non-hydrolysing)